MNKCSAIAQPVFPEEAFWIARTESIGARVAPRVIAIFFRLGRLELVIFANLATISVGEGCFLRPSFSESIIQ